MKKGLRQLGLLSAFAASSLGGVARAQPLDPVRPLQPVPSADPALPAAPAEPAEAPGVDQERAPVAPAPSEASQPPLAPGEERPLPDYDGRGDDPLTAGDVLIWIPRGLLFPAYLVSEYLIRAPLGAITSALDENDVPDIVTDFFTFGPGDKSGLVPSAFIDFGFRPSIGVYFFSDDVLVDRLGFRSHLGFGGVDWYRATGTVRYHFDRGSPVRHDSFIQLKGIYGHRPDWKFFGVGSSSREDRQSRYTAQHVEGTVRYETGFWRSSRLIAWGGVLDAQFEPRGCCDDLELGAAVQRGYYPLPPSFEDGYLVGRVGADLSLDSREERFAFEGDVSDHVSPPGNGVKLAGRGQLAGGLRESPSPSNPDDKTRLGWVSYGATLGGFLDLYEQRVLGLQLIVDFADPLDGDGEIPFTELVSLGGARPMRGYLEDRLLGRSAAVAQLEYRWPIWVFLDGTMHYAVGNVFGEHLSGFDAKLLRQSFGMGFRANGSRDHTFEFLLAFGSETVEQGSEIDSVRLVLGASEGF